MKIFADLPVDENTAACIWISRLVIRPSIGRPRGFGVRPPIVQALLYKDIRPRKPLEQILVIDVVHRNMQMLESFDERSLVLE